MDELIKYSEEQENIKVALIKYQEENGIRSDYIAKKVGLSQVTICLFKQNRRMLALDKLEKIKDIISISK